MCADMFHTKFLLCLSLSASPHLRGCRPHPPLRYAPKPGVSCCCTTSKALWTALLFASNIQTYIL